MNTYYMRVGNGQFNDEIIQKYRLLIKDLGKKYFFKVYINETIMMVNWLFANYMIRSAIT